LIGSIALVVVGGFTLLGLAAYRAPQHLKLPLLTFLGFYLLTSVFGAALLADPEVFLPWTLMFPTMDASWLQPGAKASYWVLLLGPFVIVPVVARWAMPRMRRPAVALSSKLRIQPSWLACALLASAMVLYCVVNLGVHGYLGVGLLASSQATYQENIILRTTMFGSLGELHFALMYMCIPAIAITAFHSAVREGGLGWWALAGTLILATVWLYTTTLTKANVLILGIALAVTAYGLHLVSKRVALLFAIGGVLVLALLDFLLSGAGPFELARSLLNIIFRVSSTIPFYLSVFPEQIPFVGIDVGLGRIGIGPEVPTNQVVANYMFPGDTWVQSAAPGPAHIVAYAQGGVAWSLVVMVLIGLLVGFTAASRRAAHSALSFSAFVGACIACYYASQTDFSGVFQHSYGYFWWLASLALLVGVERALRIACRPAPGARPLPSIEAS
jgi:hypothetical protein